MTTRRHDGAHILDKTTGVVACYRERIEAAIDAGGILDEELADLVSLSLVNLGKGKLRWCVEFV